MTELDNSQDSSSTFETLIEESALGDSSTENPSTENPTGSPLITEEASGAATGETDETLHEKARTRESAMLVLQRGVESGRRWPLARTRPISIGRSEECDISLPDRQVSRFHARIMWQDEQFLVEDLGSKNGTHVNGQEVKIPVALQDGDEIQIALRFKLAFVDAGATTPLTISEGEQGLRLDQETRQVWVNGELIDPPLSLHQFRLLEALWDAGGGVITREQVVNSVWPEAGGEGVSEQAIDALVRRLRERIAETDEEFRYIVTVRGHGFRLENR